MDHLLQKSTSQTLKSSLYDSSSTLSYRFARRQDSKLSSRKQHSRTSSEKSQSDMDLSKFYVKMSPNPNPNTQTPPRKNIVNRIESPVTLKKRSPTPQPGCNQKIKRQKQKHCSETIETDLFIAEIQQKYEQQKNEKEILQKRIVTFEKQLKAKISKIAELQILREQSLQREQASSKKIQQYEQMMAITESNLHEARTSLEKLKITIKQNKYAQIELDNNRLKSENKAAKQNIELLQYQIKAKDKHISTLQNEILILQSLNKNLMKESRIEQKNKQIAQLHKIIHEEKTIKQAQLESCFLKAVQENQHLKLQMDKLEIRLNYISRKKNEEIENIRQNKNELITKLRKKISHIYTQHNSLRSQYEKLKVKNLFSCIKVQRKNMMMLQDISNNDHTLFDLTPQK